MPLPTSREDEQRNQALAPEAFTLPVDAHFWSQVQAVARRRCPPLADAHIVRAWSGLYEMTPDEHPVLGKTEIEGFLCACGFSGHGRIVSEYSFFMISGPSHQSCSGVPNCQLKATPSPVTQVS